MFKGMLRLRERTAGAGARVSCPHPQNADFLKGLEGHRWFNPPGEQPLRLQAPAPRPCDSDGSHVSCKRAQDATQALLGEFYFS